MKRWIHGIKLRSPGWPVGMEHVFNVVDTVVKMSESFLKGWVTAFTVRLAAGWLWIWIKCPARPSEGKSFVLLNFLASAPHLFFVFSRWLTHSKLPSGWHKNAAKLSNPVTLSKCQGRNDIFSCHNGTSEIEVYSMNSVTISSTTTITKKSKNLERVRMDYQTSCTSHKNSEEQSIKNSIRVSPTSK